LVDYLQKPVANFLPCTATSSLAIKFGNISHQKILRPHQHAVIIPLQKPMCEGQVLNAEDCRRLLFPNVWFIYKKKTSFTFLREFVRFDGFGMRFDGFRWR
jgi:hypothetical protein